MTSRLLLRSRSTLPRVSPGFRAPCRFQSTKEENAEKFKKSFRGQLYDSTARRIQNEREQQARRIAARAEAQSGTGRVARAQEGKVSGSTLAGVFAATAIALTFYYLGSNSQPIPSVASTSPLSSATAPHHNLAKGNLEAAWTDFVTLLGEEHVSTRSDDLTRHSTSDWSSYHVQDLEPFLVVYPSTTEEVSGIAKICHDRRIPMTAYCGGTSLEGHFAATRGGICIDFSRMNKILELHKEDLDVIVQPAVGWELLNQELATDGLFFPPDPGPGAMIGGMVGTGCSGTNASHYGTMREWVISLTVVLADGTVIKTRQRPRKSSAGYNLTQMFIGSEGTLGLVTEATLKLTVKPQNETVAVASFPSVRHAAATCAALIGQGVPVAAIELLDDVQMRCINAAGSTSREWKEVPTLFFKFNGTSSGVKEQVAQVKAIGKQFGSQSFEFAKSKDEADELWSARKEALWSVVAMKRNDDDKVWTTDVAVPLSKLPDIIEETKEDISKSGLLGSIVGHVGDGNFHSILTFSKEQQPTAEGVVHRMVKRAIEMEGTVTGEHGVGLVKRDYLNHELSQETVDAMRRLKMAYDPLCLLNCDKVVRVEPKKPGERNH